jgi:hypothetical protein
MPRSTRNISNQQSGTCGAAMKRLIVNGRPTGKNVDHNLIRNSIIYFEKTLFECHADALNQIELSINFIPGLQKQFSSTGFSSWADGPINPKKFIIELDNGLDYKTALITAAHEFTHVKQYATGEKQDSLDGMTVRWFGMKITVDDMHYYDHPWEIEAHGREYGMYDRYINRDNAALDPAKIVGSKFPPLIAVA